MKIALYDKDDSEVRRPWSEYLTTHELIFVQDLASKLDSSITAAFAHGSYLGADLVSQFRQENNSIPFVVVSGGSPAAWWSDGQLSYWRKTPVGKSKDDPFSRHVKEFLKYLNEQQTPYFSLLEPLDNQTRWALRFLCEAWLLKHWSVANDYRKEDFRKISGFETYTPTLPTSILIRAPNARAEWLAPFGVDADELAKQMKETTASEAVTSFFRDFNEQSPEFTRVADLFLAISVSLTPIGIIQ